MLPPARPGRRGFPLQLPRSISSIPDLPLHTQHPPYEMPSCRNRPCQPVSAVLAASPLLCALIPVIPGPAGPVGLPSARSRLPALPGHAGDRALPEALGNALSSGPRSACSGSWRPAQPPASPWTCPGWGPASVWTLGRPWFWPRLAGGWPCELAVWAHRFSRRRVPQLWSAERGHGTLPGDPAVAASS